MKINLNLTQKFKFLTITIHAFVIKVKNLRNRQQILIKNVTAKTKKMSAIQILKILIFLHILSAFCYLDEDENDNGCALKIRQCTQKYISHNCKLDKR